MINDLSSGFKAKYPNVIVKTQASHSETAFQSLEDGSADIAFVSTPAGSIDKSIYTFNPFARDILVLILNFNNAYLQTLVINGISKKSIAEILELKITAWKMVNKRIEGNEPVKMYIPSRKSGTLDYIARFAGLTKDRIIADDVLLENDVPVNVGNMPVAIGFCSHTLAYDFSTKLRKSNIYIVGIDINNNGILDNEELIYDDLDMLMQSVSNNKAPAELIREFSLCNSNDSKNMELITLFTQYVQKNVNEVMNKYKFLSPKKNSK
jgi:ABC-type phosphate transport system substrate-binding protein